MKELLNRKDAAGRILSVSKLRSKADGFRLNSMLLPSVETFLMLSKLKDNFMENLFHLERALAREFLVKGSTDVRVRRANRYLTRQWKRLGKLAKAGDQMKYFRLARLMLKSSQALRLLSMFKVDKHWYKKMPGDRLIAEWKALARLCRGKETGYKWRRVYIPKREGGPPERPLSVPTLAHRVYANMMYSLTWKWIEGQKAYPKWQHGGRPGTGVVSCWKELWKILQDPSIKDIYEFDLTKFFDRVNLGAVVDAMENFCFESSLAPWNNHNPWTKFIVDHMAASQGKINEEDKEKETLDIDMSYSSFQHLPEKKMMAEMEEGYILPTYPWWWDPVTFARYGGNLRGVPQGFSLSPLLACLTLGHAIEILKDKQIYDLLGLTKKARDRKPENMRSVDTRDPNHLSKNLLMYMDDGILFGKKLETKMTSKIESFKAIVREVGTEVNEKKSGWLKKDGVWKKESFKFLGLRYWPDTQTLQANTRKGATLRFPIADLLEGKLKITGISGKALVEQVERDPVDGAINFNLFSPIIAHMWRDGKPPQYLQEANGEKIDPRILVVQGRSYLGYLIENTNSDRLSLVNASSRATAGWLKVSQHLTGTKKGARSLRDHPLWDWVHNPTSK